MNINHKECKATVRQSTSERRALLDRFKTRIDSKGKHGEADSEMLFLLGCVSLVATLAVCATHVSTENAASDHRVQRATEFRINAQVACNTKNLCLTPEEIERITRDLQKP